ncbi:MAG TPA: Clp protease N-terminal domain-containing protein [Blastocatellia bacterium]|nr:Clp protease N-terminal domain-containing protein [Blastocatellia bacterium]
MFEKYTEKARRVIFFARYEASMLGTQAIEAEHILLGLLREDKQITEHFFSDPLSAAESIRKEIEVAFPMRDKVPTSVDLPLSPSAKQTLSLAAQCSDRFGHYHIGTEHLLLGLIKEGESLASKILSERAVTEERAIDYINQEGLSDRSATPRFTIYSGRELSYQFTKLICLMAERGILSREELFRELAEAHRGSAAIEAAFDMLLNLLVSKGVISDDDRSKITEVE